MHCISYIPQTNDLKMRLVKASLEVQRSRVVYCLPLHSGKMNSMSGEMLLCSDGQAGYGRRAEQAQILHEPLQACTANANAKTTAACKHGASAPTGLPSTKYILIL